MLVKYRHQKSGFGKVPKACRQKNLKNLLFYLLATVIGPLTVIYRQANYTRDKRPICDFKNSLITLANIGPNLKYLTLADIFFFLFLLLLEFIFWCEVHISSVSVKIITVINRKSLLSHRILLLIYLCSKGVGVFTCSV